MGGLQQPLLPLQEGPPLLALLPVLAVLTQAWQGKRAPLGVLAHRLLLVWVLLLPLPAAALGERPPGGLTALGGLQPLLARMPAEVQACVTAAPAAASAPAHVASGRVPTTWAVPQDAWTDRAGLVPLLPAARHELLPVMLQLEAPGLLLQQQLMPAVLDRSVGTSMWRWVCPAAVVGADGGGGRLFWNKCPGLQA